MKSNPFWEERHVGMTLNFSPVVKVVILVALFCVLQTTGLPNSDPITPHHFHHNHRNTSHHFRNRLQHISSSSDVITQTSHQDHLQDEPFRLDPLDEDTYDPVEAYHQLRRKYLTSTSRVDRAHYGIDGWDSGRTRHHTHSQGNYHQTPNNHQGGIATGGGSSGSSDRDNNRNENGRRYGQINGESAHYPHLPLNQQKCYVCLPPNKSSREAQAILSMFGKQDPRDIADCAEFTQANANAYEFNCPPGFDGGCILRIHGLNVSRACSKRQLNECKKANSVEFCYCTEPLCNDVKLPPARLYSTGEDDDEDGLGGSGDRSNKDDETPSDSELLHTPSTSDNKNKDRSEAQANFNDNGSTDQEDVRSLTDSDLNLGNSSADSKSLDIFLLVLSVLLVLWMSECRNRLMSAEGSNAKIRTITHCS